MKIIQNIINIIIQGNAYPHLAMKHATLLRVVLMPSSLSICNRSKSIAIPPQSQNPYFSILTQYHFCEVTICCFMNDK